MRWLLLIAPLTLLPLTSCEQDSTQHDRAEAACRTEVARADDQTNRLDLAQRDTSTTPLSAGGVPGINTAPIIERSVHDQAMADCLNGTGGSLNN